MDDIPSPKTLPGSFEPHQHDTWLFGFEGTHNLFDPYSWLSDRYGDDFDPGRFDFTAYETAVANASFQVSMRRIETVFGQSAPPISLQGIGGKGPDGLHVQVTVCHEFVRFLRRYICQDGGYERQGQHLSDFSSWLDTRYKSRPGFHPWHSTDPEDWLEATSGFTDFRGCRQGHKLGALLKFVVTHCEEHYGETWSNLDIYYDASEHPISPELHYSETAKVA